MPKGIVFRLEIKPDKPYGLRTNLDPRSKILKPICFPNPRWGGNSDLKSLNHNSYYKI